MSPGSESRSTLLSPVGLAPRACMAVAGRGVDSRGAENPRRRSRREPERRLMCYRYPVGTLRVPGDPRMPDCPVTVARKPWAHLDGPAYQ